MPMVEDIILDYIRRSTGNHDTTILPDHRLYEDLNLDSLDSVELALHFEEALDQVVDDVEIYQEAKTVGDLCRLIKERYGLE